MNWLWFHILAAPWFPLLWLTGQRERRRRLFAQCVALRQPPPHRLDDCMREIEADEQRSRAAAQEEQEKEEASARFYGRYDPRLRQWILADGSRTSDRALALMNDHRHPRPADLRNQSS